MAVINSAPEHPIREELIPVEAVSDWDESSPWFRASIEAHATRTLPSAWIEAILDDLEPSTPTTRAQQ